MCVLIWCVARAFSVRWCGGVCGRAVLSWVQVKIIVVIIVVNIPLLIIECVVLGLGAGLVYGVFGGGSGLILTPGFYYLLHHFALMQSHPMQMAIATTATASAFLGIFATRVQWRHRNIDLTVFKLIAPGVLVGTLLAVGLLNVIPSDYLKRLFGIVVIGVAVWLSFYRQERDTRTWSLSALYNRVLTSVIGFLWFLLGISVFIVPYLHKCGMELRRAIGCATLTSTVFSAVAGILLVVTGLFQVGTSGGHVGFVSVPLVLIVVIPSAITAHWGSRLSVKLPKRTLKIIYSGLLCGVGILMLL